MLSDSQNGITVAPLIGLVGLHFLKIPYYCFNKFGTKVKVNACAQPTIFKQKSYDSANNQGRHYYPHFFFKGEFKWRARITQHIMLDLGLVFILVLWLQVQCSFHQIPKKEGCIMSLLKEWSLAPEMWVWVQVLPLDSCILLTNCLVSLQWKFLIGILIKWGWYQ